MNLPIRLAVLAVAACLCLSEAAPDARLQRSKQRPTRGFKAVEMMTARGFGKRDRPSTRAEHEDSLVSGFRRLPMAMLVARSYGKRDGNDPGSVAGETRYLSKRGFKPNSNVLVARGFGKRDEERVYGEDNFLDTLESSPQKEQAESEEKPFESVPIEWFVNELVNNQEFARSVVKKFIDVNQDGVLSTEELLRNPA